MCLNDGFIVAGACVVGASVGAGAVVVVVVVVVVVAAGAMVGFGFHGCGLTGAQTF